MAARNRLNCYVCNARFQPRVMVLIYGEAHAQKREIAVTRRNDLNHPGLEIDANTRICFNCNQSINREIRDLEADPTCIRLNVLKQTRNRYCLFCGEQRNTSRLSGNCRVKIFILRNIYAPPSVRSCPHHLDQNGFVQRLLLDGLEFVNRPYRLPGPELNNLLQVMRREARPDEPNFNDENSFTDDEFRCVTSISKAQFDDMYRYCEGNNENENHGRRVHRKDLLTFLCKLRQGLSDEFLKLIFKYSSRQAVSLAISTVRRCLMVQFVPENIGLNAINRQQYIEQHVTELANRLYNQNPELPVAIAYLDATYSYIPKSSNFRALRHSYSLHKGRHLVKPALIVAPDGYILDIQGPYFSDSANNDAAILQNEYENNINGIREWFENGDIFIFDRGYRDVLPYFENLGIRCKMPALLPRGQRQLDTEEANDCRLITKTRWLVEARNGHIKSMFKFFNDSIPMDHASHLGDFYRIAGAIINRYKDRIQMQEADGELAETMLRRAREPNVVQTRVENDHLERRNGGWVRLNENHAPNFPRLDIDYLKEITMGIYQINLSPSYIQDKLQREGTETFEFDERFDEPGLMRVRLYSRFRNAAKYQLFIAFRADDDPDERAAEHEPLIFGYYCTCKSGARTLGSCAHVASVLWFLGHARHQPHTRYPTTVLLDNVVDAAHRPRQRHVQEIQRLEEE